MLDSSDCMYTFPPKGFKKGTHKVYYFDVFRAPGPRAPKEVPRGVQGVPNVAKMVSKKWQIDSKGCPM